MRTDMTMMLLTFVWMVTTCALSCALFVYVREAKMWQNRAEQAMCALRAVMGGASLMTFGGDDEKKTPSTETDDDPVH